MSQYRLNQDELDKLWLAHHTQRDKHKADRLKAVYLLGMGWEASDIATALLLSEKSIYNYYHRYKARGLKELVSNHYESHNRYLTDKQLLQLEKHLEGVVYLRVDDIIEYVKQRFKIEYSRNGLRDTLHRLGFVYKKPKLAPQAANKQQQQSFIRKYRQIKARCTAEDAIYFMDATHPHYQAVAGYGWIKKGKEKVLPLTLQQLPFNINGAINIDELKGVFNYKQKSLNKEDTLDMLEALRKQHPRGHIHLFCDRGGCYKSADVQTYAASMAIEVHYLPPRCPHLNVIERLWKFLRKKALSNRYYPSYSSFSEAIKQFLSRLHRYKSELSTLLTDDFQIINI